MRGFFKNLALDKITRIGFAGTLGIVMLGVGVIIFYYNSLPPFVPIFNQLSWGEQRLGVKSSILFPLSIAFVIFLFNFVLALVVYKKIPLVSRILAISSLTVSVLVLFFTLRTIYLIL